MKQEFFPGDIVSPKDSGVNPAWLEMEIIGWDSYDGSYTVKKKGGAEVITGFNLDPSLGVPFKRVGHIDDK